MLMLNKHAAYAQMDDKPKIAVYGTRHK